MSHQSAVAYAGDIVATEAHRLLSADPASVLVDVRTKAEWSYVGVPDLKPIGKTAFFLEWQSFPAMLVDPGFVAATRQRRSSRRA